MSFLEKIKLFNSNLQIIDEAFEYLIPQVSKKKEGQFFTPRSVVDMVIKMLNPKANEIVVDPACGSAGFLLHSVMWVAGGVITGKELPLSARNFAQNNITGIDFASKAVKIAKAINLIVGDGKSHVYKANSLAPDTWDDETKAGLRPRLSRFPANPEKDRENQKNFTHFDFDVLMTNPPFAGTVKQREILRIYELAEKNGRLVRKIGRHILFLNRSLQFISPGGRMAIVLPQGLLNNTSLEYIRRWIIRDARILAVVGLHVNTFKPHTGTKTSVLFLQKYTDKEKQESEKVRAEYEVKWQDFIGRLKDQYQTVNWNTEVNEEKIPEELKSFIEIHFETNEDSETSERTEQANDESVRESENYNLEEKEPFLAEEITKLEETLKKKLRELSSADSGESKKALAREIQALRTTLSKISQEASERTLGGRIHLSLNEQRTCEEFKRFWIENNVFKKIDYPIFFAVNLKPVKDNTGEYRYRKGPNGEFILDKNGHPLIIHDLNEIADDFIKFAKEKEFDFWRD